MTTVSGFSIGVLFNIFAASFGFNKPVDCPLKLERTISVSVKAGQTQFALENIEDKNRHLQKPESLPDATFPENGLRTKRTGETDHCVLSGGVDGHE